MSGVRSLVLIAVMVAALGVPPSARGATVATHAAFWLRIDGPNGHMDGFDNMSNRALVGNADWTPFVIVLDVPDDAKQIVGGLLLIGTGTVWADDLHIQTVPKTVPTTAL